MFVADDVRGEAINKVPVVYAEKGVGGAQGPCEMILYTNISTIKLSLFL